MECSPGFLNREKLAFGLAVWVQSAEWRWEYNEARLHLALGDQAAAEFAARSCFPVGATPLHMTVAPKPETYLIITDGTESGASHRYPRLGIQ